MNKRERYITTIFTLDKNIQIIGLTKWDNADIFDFLDEQERRYGLKLINLQEEIRVIVEYTNIIWHYRIFYGSFKKKYALLTDNDERWLKIEKQIETDLKKIGLEELEEKIISSLKTKKHFEYKISLDKQFKNYCV